MNWLLFQLQTFILTGLTGIAAGFIFHYYLLTIRKARIGKYFLYILDLILWIFILIMVFAAMLFINQGEIRFYVLLTLLAGVIVYFRCLSARLTNFIAQGASGTIFIVASFSHLAGIIPGWLKKILKPVKEEPPLPPLT
ncbi:MAG: spore cortex biosynthesis protein YabQ [Syntrophomonadaceae bacterium]|nr:spore cortex biosynthesis protein YabQ [Syntrophomonadaceae bacterium]